MDFYVFWYKFFIGYGYHNYILLACVLSFHFPYGAFVWTKFPDFNEIQSLIHGARSTSCPHETNGISTPVLYNIEKLIWDRW